jgi:hypothetical protein
MTKIEKAEPRSLCVRRDVVNKADIVKWAKAQGFETVQESMHVTLAFSREPIDWMTVGESYSDKDGELTIPEGGPRVLRRGHCVAVRLLDAVLAPRGHQARRRKLGPSAVSAAHHHFVEGR